MPRRGSRPALRLLTLLVASTLSLAGIGVRLVHLQVVEASEYEDLGARQRVRRLELPARRGAIFDRNGIPLAVSVEARAVYANPRFVEDPDATATAVAKVLGADAASLKEKLRRKSGFVYLARKVDVAVAGRVVALNLAGVGTLDESKRFYPQGPLAAQVLGYVGLDNQGLGGIEARFDDVLAGVPGEMVVEQDPYGRPIASGRREVRKPVRGRDVTLTIDRDVQYQAERALAESVAKTGARDGTAVVMDARTNEILAMANYPPFDPARFAEAPASVRRNFAVQDAYEPGSVNKLVTAAAALESGLVRPSDMMAIPSVLRVGNHTVDDFKSHPLWRITYSEALARSSNVGTIQIALKIGARRVATMIDGFGLGSRTGVEAAGESPGVTLPVDEWSRTSIATIPIGHGIAVTPIQMLNVYTTIARDGIWAAPRLVRTVGGKTAPPPRPNRRVISTFTAAQLRGILLGVVEGGTGRSARIPGYLIGGKTGTAAKPLVGRRGYSPDVITTFIGMVPVDRPRFVVAVALDSPDIHQAAATAAPAFQRITSFVLARWGVPPQVVPTGKDARKALRPARAPAPAAKPSTAPTPAATPKPSHAASPTPAATPAPTPARAAAPP